MDAQSQVIGKAVIQAEVDGAGIDAGVAQGKRSIASLGPAAKAAGAEASAGLAGLSAGAEQAGAKVEAVTKRMVQDIQRQIAVTQAGARGTAEYYQALANQRGVDPRVLEPYIQQLKAAQAAQGGFVGGNKQLQESVAATQQQLRQVAPQVTDIVTSLAGGQAPLQVLIQQGGQLKDVFGGIGPAARALGGFVASLVTPFTVAAAAAAALTFAYVSGSKEAVAFERSIILSGNAAGVTTGQLQLMARAISENVGTQGKAAETLAQLTTGGRVAGDNLQRFSEVAIRLDRIGIPIKDTAQALAELGKAPVEASIKLNEQYNYLSASTFQRIVELKEQGRQEEAASLAQNTYATAMEGREQRVVKSLGAIEKAWLLASTAASKGWDAILGVGRTATGEAQLADVAKNIETLQEQINSRNARGLSSGDLSARLAAAQALRQTLEATVAVDRSSAAAEAKRVEQGRAATEFQKLVLKYRSDEKKLQDEINEARNLGLASGAKQAEIEQVIASIRGRGQKPSGPKADPFAAEREFAKEYADAFKDFSKIQAEAEAKTIGLSKAQARLVEYLTSPAYAAHSEAMRQIVLQAAYAAIASEQEAEARKTANEAIRDAVKLYNEQIDVQRKAADAVAKQVENLTTENAALAYAQARQISLKEAIEELTIARLEERKVASLGNEELVLQIQREIDQRRKLRDELGIQAANQKADDVAKRGLQDQVRLLGDVDETARRVFTTVGREGSNAFQRIGDTLKSAVLDVLYQITLRPFVINLAAQLTGASAGAALQATGGGGLGNLLNLAGSAGQFVTGGGTAGLIGSGVGALFGQAAGNAALGTSLGLGASSSAAAASAAATAGGASAAGAGLGATLGTAIPYIGLALAAASLFGGSKGGPKTVSGASEASTIQAAVTATLKQFGITQPVTVGAFVAQDPAGDALTQVQAAAFANGRPIYSRQDRLGGFENVGRSSEELAAALAEEQSRILLAALKESLEPKYLRYLAEVDANTSQVDAINAAINRVTQARQLELQLLELSSTPAENLARARQAELDAMDAALRPLRQQVFAQQDLKDKVEATNRALTDSVKTAYDQYIQARQQERDSLKETINRLRDYSGSLREFRDSLLLGGNSPLTPGQQLEEARRQLLNTADAARGGDPKAQARVQDLVSKFLEASATFNASGAGFQSDFAFAQNLLDDLATNAAASADVAQLQLDAANSQLSLLGVLNETTRNGLDKMAELARATLVALTAGLNPGAQTLAALTGGVTGRFVDTPIGSVYADTGGATGLGVGGGNYRVYTKDGQILSGVQLRDEIIRAIEGGATAQDFAMASLKTGISRSATLDAIAGTGYESRLPMFEKGTDFVPFNGPAFLHYGERVTPAAYNRSDATNAQLLSVMEAQQAQITLLRKDVRDGLLTVAAATYEATAQAANTTVEGLATASTRRQFEQANTYAPSTT